ncbi:MAG: pyruvate ferredoxin oxidoreductase [Firmicutes bacterium]|nr:pyruvate ferredoxin oxidoreductase [Candidatus Fermentithermobacillaceae bacterium]
MASLKELSAIPEVLAPGHRLCAGCGAPIVVRQITRAAKGPLVVTNATGCLEVSTTVYPYTSWNTPWIHTAFENAAATASGVEAAYQSLKRQGKVDKDVKFVVFGGDGGTYDIGFQSLSGAMERNHNLVYVCYDNGAYMNTGIQRSSATPKGADTTTSPVGKVSYGKRENRKDLTQIMAAHNIPYAAQVSPAHWNDLYQKAEKAFAANGAAFITALAPCPRGWRHDAKDTIEVCRLAVDTCFWPLYEVVEGKTRVTYKPREKKPVTEFLKTQGRFRHLFQPGNEAVLEEIQKEVDRRWEELLALEEISNRQSETA